MKKREDISVFFNRLIGLILLVQLSVPGSVWHSFAEHEDSHHCTAVFSGDAVGEKHIHCPALELNLPLADRLEGICFRPFAFISINHLVEPVSDIRSRYQIGVLPRGPPPFSA